MLLPCICNYVVFFIVQICQACLSVMRESAFINVLCETAHPVQHEFSVLM